LNPRGRSHTYRAELGTSSDNSGIMTARAKRNGAAGQENGLAMASWAARRQAAYLAAEQEIARLRPGEAIVYHEGNLVIDITDDPAIAGRAAAFRDASEAAAGLVAQRRLGFERYQYVFWRAQREQR
jgi:hypothetical protein